MTAVVDYGAGNLYSLMCSLRWIGTDAAVTDKEEVIRSADRVILPGVGAFADAMKKLERSGLAGVLREEAEKKPLLGICLGMQMLFERSFEFGEHEGLGLIPGEVLPLESALSVGGFDYKTPHMGWNPLEIKNPDCGILRYTKPGDFMYYVHSYYAGCLSENIDAVSEYGIEVPGVVSRGLIYGVQFHPEKSGDRGLRILRAFTEV